MDKDSLENMFKAMKMSELKKFLQDRGITVNSYLKPDLEAIACAVEEMNFPPQCKTTEAEEKLNNVTCMVDHLFQSGFVIHGL